MAIDPRFPQVQFLAPGDSPHGSDNFQHVPPLPRVAPFGALERSPMFPGSGGNKVALPGAAANVNDPHHYANCITGNFLDGGANTPFLIVQKNDVRRNLLGFRNTAGVGGPTLFIDFGKQPSAQSWLALFAATATAPGDIVMFDTVVPQDDVWVSGSAGAYSVAFIYSTIPNNV